MSLEANKIAAAILVGGMLTLGVGLVANKIYGGHEGAEQGEAKEAAPAAMPAAPAAPIAPVSGLLAAADPAKGEATAKACAACHSFGKGEAAKVGPNLWGVVGGPTAHMEGFSYSPAVAGLKSTWTFENLNHFLTSPKAYAPGTKMTFPGLPKVEDRANVIVWLNSKSDAPLALPTAEEIKAAEDAAKQAAAAPAATETPAAEAPAVEAAAAPAAGGDADDAVKLIATADPAAGEKVATKCKACHDFSKGGPNKVGPNLWGVVGGPSAHKDDYKYDDAINNLKITWDFANLDKFLTSPKAFAQGTKMTFPGLPKAADRAALLRWLRDQSDSPVPLPQ